MLKFCLPDYKVYGVEEIDHGSYTVGGTTCVEAQINGLVSRVFLSPVIFNDYSINKSKHLMIPTKARKRKLDKNEDSKVPLHKKINRTIKQPSFVKKETDRKMNSFKELVAKPSPEVKRFNGDNLPSKRQRKPNSKFSDFIIPSNYNLIDEPDTDDTTDKSDTDSLSTPKMKILKPIKDIKVVDTKLRLHKARVKERILTQTDDEQKLDTNLTVDPLDIHHSDDVVHSFLPMFEPPPILNYDSEDQEPSRAKPVDKKVQPSLSSKGNDKIKEAVQQPVKNIVTQPITIFSPNWKGTDNKSPKLVGKVLCMPLILTTNSQNTAINANDVANQQLAFLNKPEQRWVQIQPKPSFSPSQSPGIKREMPKKPVSYKKVAQKGSNVNVKPKSYGPTELKTKPVKVLSSSRYILVDCDAKYKPIKLSDIDFNKLVRSLKLVKLPAKNWKIRIIVSPQETITEVIFTNKETIERCVKFSRAVAAGYKITFGKSEVKLLGAPTLQTFDDIAILLEIIHSISPNSHVLEYC